VVLSKSTPNAEWSVHVSYSNTDLNPQDLEDFTLQITDSSDSSESSKATAVKLTLISNVEVLKDVATHKIDISPVIKKDQEEQINKDANIITKPNLSTNTAESF